MKISGKGVVYKGQYGYTISESVKNIQGNYDRYFIPIAFPKNMEQIPNDKELIEFDGFTKPYKNKAGTTLISYFAMNWKQVEPSKKPEVVVEKEKVDPYELFAKEVPVEQVELPF